MRTVADLEVEARRRQLWLYTLCAAALTAIAELYFDLVNQPYSRVSPLRQLRIVHVVLLTVILLWLAWARRRATARQCVAAAAAVLLPVPFLLWLNQELMLRIKHVPDPLIANRLVIILVAVFFPGSPRVVITLVSGLALMGVVHVELWRASGVPIASLEEPVTLVFHWAIAAVIVFLRASLGRVQRRYHRARAAILALQQIAGISRALRDGANTPLQTIDALAFVERVLDPRLGEVAERLERSSAQLHRVLEALHYEDLAGWTREDVGFEAERRIAMLQESLLRDAASGTPREQRP